jgi:hypothetical protein
MQQSLKAAGVWCEDPVLNLCFDQAALSMKIM